MFKKIFSVAAVILTNNLVGLPDVPPLLVSLIYGCVSLSQISPLPSCLMQSRWLSLSSAKFVSWFESKDPLFPAGTDMLYVSQRGDRNCMSKTSRGFLFFLWACLQILSIRPLSLFKKWNIWARNFKDYKSFIAQEPAQARTRDHRTTEGIHTTQDQHFSYSVYLVLHFSQLQSLLFLFTLAVYIRKYLFKNLWKTLQ